MTSGRPCAILSIFPSSRCKGKCSEASSSRAVASAASLRLLASRSRSPQASTLNTRRSSSEMYGKFSVSLRAGLAAVGRKGHSQSGTILTSISEPLARGKNMVPDFSRRGLMGWLAISLRTRPGEEDLLTMKSMLCYCRDVVSMNGHGWSDKLLGVKGSLRQDYHRAPGIWKAQDLLQRLRSYSPNQACR